MSEPKTKTVIFSKNRTVQPKSVLRSLRENSDINAAEIDVIYIAESGMPSEPLTSQLACRLVKHGDRLVEIASAIEGSGCNRVLFMSDDVTSMRAGCLDFDASASQRQGRR